MNSETKVGIFVLAGLLLIGAAIFLLGDFSLSKQYPIYVEFKDVAGLPDKSLVKLSGVEVGKVKSVTIEGSKVVVRLAIKDGVEIYRDSRFFIGSTSIIGSKFLQIDQGSLSSGIISPGERVKGDDTLPLDRMIVSTLGSMQTMLDDISRKGRLGEHINIIAEQLQATLANVRELTATMNDLIASSNPHLSRSSENIEFITKKIDALLSKADEFIAKLNTGQGAVGALVSDKKVKDDVTATVSNLKEVSASAKNMFNRIGGYRVYWSYENRAEPAAKTSRSNVGLKISPREGRYYYLGMSNIANTADRPRGPDYLEKNKIEAQLGWEFKNAQLYAGFLHGAGGAGISLSPFYSIPALDRLALFAEGSDFLRNREISGRLFDKPRYDVGANVKLNRIVSVGVRSADIKGTGNTQYGAKITFEDKDIAYLLGLLSFGTTRATGEKK
ncbi:MAG: MlaD family protein [Elusimicrobia bacterium]|nr:MlaD family protein [Elusimicrobiota bacterium]